MTVDELYRLALQAEVFGRTNLEELTRQGGIAATERVLQRDPELRRRFAEEGGRGVDDPLVVARFQAAIEADAFEKPE